VKQVKVLRINMDIHLEWEAKKNGGNQQGSRKIMNALHDGKSTCGYSPDGPIK
jgi:hypothetical protein